MNPKSWIGSRYSGYTGSSSLFRKTASAVIGPGLTTCLLVRIRPLSLSTINPVAKLDPADSVSKDLADVTLRTTTQGTTFFKVSCQE